MPHLYINHILAQNLFQQVIAALRAVFEDRVNMRMMD
jgi:hypothetical protein